MENNKISFDEFLENNRDYYIEIAHENCLSPESDEDKFDMIIYKNHYVPQHGIDPLFEKLINKEI